MNLAAISVLAFAMSTDAFAAAVGKGTARLKPRWSEALRTGAKGLLLRAGAVVDATLIAAPSSTKNASGERDPEMKDSKKGNQWYFGMKAHIGMDADSGLVHTVHGTAGSVDDVVEANSLLHGEEIEAWGDAGYQGAAKRPDAGLHTRRIKLHAPQ